MIYRTYNVRKAQQLDLCERHPVTVGRKNSFKQEDPSFLSEEV